MKIDARVRRRDTKEGRGYQYGLSTLGRALNANAPPELIASCCSNTLARIYGGYFRAWVGHTSYLLRLKWRHLHSSIWLFYHRRILRQDQATIERLITEGD